jgi:hypothetical protein
MASIFITLAGDLDMIIWASFSTVYIVILLVYLYIGQNI